MGVGAAWRQARSAAQWWRTLSQARLFSSRLVSITAPHTQPAVSISICMHFAKREELSLLTVLAFPKASSGSFVSCWQPQQQAEQAGQASQMRLHPPSAPHAAWTTETSAADTLTSCQCCQLSSFVGIGIFCAVVGMVLHHKLRGQVVHAGSFLLVFLNQICGGQVCKARRRTHDCSINETRHRCVGAQFSTNLQHSVLPAPDSPQISTA